MDASVINIRHHYLSSASHKILESTRIHANYCLLLTSEEYANLGAYLHSTFQKRSHFCRFIYWTPTNVSTTYDFIYLLPMLSTSCEHIYCLWQHLLPMNVSNVNFLRASCCDFSDTHATTMNCSPPLHMQLFLHCLLPSVLPPKNGFVSKWLIKGRILPMSRLHMLPGIFNRIKIHAWVYI